MPEELYRNARYAYARRLAASTQPDIAAHAVGVLQVAGILGLEVLSNGLVNGSWTLPSMHTSRADDTACADGAADTHRAERAGSAAKKQL